MNTQITTVLISLIAFLGLASATSAPPAPNAAAVEGSAVTYAIIINNKNSFAGDDAKAKDILKQLFLKRRTSWPNKSKAKPLSREAGGDEQAAFLSEVLGMKVAALEKHWISLKQKTGQTPPNQVKSSKMLIKFVSKYDGAFGVVTEAEAKSASKKVKTLMTFSAPASK